MSDVYIRGAEQLKGQLATLARSMNGERAVAALAACKVFEREAKHYATGYEGGPAVQTGMLRNSISARISAPDEAQVAPSAEYATYVEYGTGIYAEGGGGRDTPWTYQDAKSGKFIRTVGSHPHPFMRPAYEAGREQAEIVLKAKLLSVLSASGKMGGQIGAGFTSYKPEL